MNHFIKPKLRNVSVQRTIYQGEPVLLLQDSLKLTEGAILLPQVLGPLALLCDGDHTLPEIKVALEARFGLPLSQTVIEDLLQQFDQALLLENETYHQAKQAALAAYRAASFRQPALAGHSYPGQADELRQMLQRYLDQAGEVEPSPAGSRGIISPHIDYSRGGLSYAQLWASAAEAVRQAELVIILGTAHNGGDYGSLTLTPQNYASPLGVMPTDKALVNRLAEALGPENAFAGELLHASEWSIELVLIWLQYLRREEPCPILPVLCGSFHHFMTGQADIENEPKFKQFVDLLREEMSKRRTVIVASGDLAHLGPAFDSPPLDLPAQTQMEKDDVALIEALCQGKANSFFDFMQAGQYKRNVCGLSPFYFTLQALGETRGQEKAYARCPADHNNSSFVSVCGIVLT